MIVDASVAVKWFYEEDGTDIARALAASNLAAPDLIYAEVANALWAKRRRGELGDDIEPLSSLDNLVTEAVPILTLTVGAFALALQLGHPVYDCFYLALALREDRPLVTADLHFLGKCATSPYARHVISLADWLPA